MRKASALRLFSVAVLLIPELSLAQAFGEYGRAVGIVPRGFNSSLGGSGNSGPTIDTGGLGNLESRVLPSRLVVISRGAAVFPRQDEESEQIAQLSEGEKVVPILHSEGSINWYMVKTGKGLIGWVKSANVRKDEEKKKQ